MLRIRLIVALYGTFCMACVLNMAAPSAHAAIPLMINHQGLVKVNGLPFTGNGLFKFGFVDAANLWLWTNDGTHVGELANTQSPNAAITLPTTNGIYSVRLGDTAFVNMVTIPSTVFDGPDVKLRVLFNDGSNGWQTLSPDQPVTATGYAYHAATADNATQADNALALEGLSVAQLAVPTGYAILGYTETPPLGYSAIGSLLAEEWQIRANMPTNRASPAVASANGIVYVFGGSDSPSTHSNANEAYDPATDTWSVKAPMPATRSEGGAATVGSVIYVIGGSRNHAGVAAGVTTEAYDSSTNSWSTKASMPTGRVGVMVIELNEIIYAIGGYNGSSALSTNEAYDPVTNSWSTKADMPTGRGYAGVAVASGLIFVCGGNNGGAGILGVNEAYDPVTNTWAVKAPMPTARAALSAAGTGGWIHAFNGNGAGSTYLSLNEAYNPTVDSWYTLSPPPTARAACGVASISGRICLVGGADAPSSLVGTTEMYGARVKVFVKN